MFLAWEYSSLGISPSILSMEFLIGRSLANNVMNLLLGPLAKRVADDKGLDWLALLEQEPDAGLGNGGQDVRRRACARPCLPHGSTRRDPRPARAKWL
jgi:hypothetical protein